MLQAGLQLESDGELLAEIRVSLVSGDSHLLELQQLGLELFLSCSLLDLDGAGRRMDTAVSVRVCVIQQKEQVSHIQMYV